MHSTTRPASVRRNIELKARLRDIAAARRVAEALATSRLGTQHQVDTYFPVPRGRLKLRQIDGLSALLIAYHRQDQHDSKSSNYRLVPIANPETLKLALREALTISVIVDKRREIFLWSNVRIHLDLVKDLGAFIEFEAVLEAGEDDHRGHAQLAELRRRFQIQDEDLIAVSYGDLLLASRAAGGSQLPPSPPTV
jgi:predicted adenylyl cyclase CyaB